MYMEVENNIRVVYGTLKKGKPNHRRFGLDKAEFIGTTKIHGYRMYDLGYYPIIFQAGYEVPPIEAEIYSVHDKAILDKIDKMEIASGYKCVTDVFLIEETGEYIEGVFYVGIKRLTYLKNIMLGFAKRIFNY